jgi:hypothetical protein
LAPAESPDLGDNVMTDAHLSPDATTRSIRSVFDAVETPLRALD